MATNPLRKEIVQASESLVVKTSKPKPPQNAFTVGVLDKPGVSIPQIQVAVVPKSINKLVIPATWTEAIRDPQVWAELRPVLVDED